MTDLERPWPRFTASTPRPREVDPAAPWPHWGSLPEPPVATPSYTPPRTEEPVIEAPPVESPAIEHAAAETERVREPVAEATDEPEPVEARVVPRASSTALVPVRQRREVALVDVARAVRRASPAIAVASVAAVAALAFFRRR